MTITTDTVSQLTELKLQRDKLLKTVSKLDEAIKVLEGSTEKPVEWKNSALNCIKKHNFPMRTVDILNCMSIIEPSKFLLKDYKKRHNYISALSIALNNLCDNNILGRLRYDGFRGYFYGIKEWHLGEFGLIPAIDEKFRHELWSNPGSIFNFSPLENDLVDDDIDENFEK